MLSAAADNAPILPNSIAPAQMPSAGGASGTTVNTAGNTAVGATAAGPTPGPLNSTPVISTREACLVEQTINRMMLAVNPAGNTMLATWPPMQSSLVSFLLFIVCSALFIF